MVGKGLVKKLVAAFAAAASAVVAIGAFGFAVFYGLSLVVVPVAAAALTFLLFAVVAALIVAVFLKEPDGHADDEDEEPESMVSKAVNLIKERPILGAAGGLGVLFFLLRNPALAAIVASMVTEKRMESRGYRRRR